LLINANIACSDGNMSNLKHINKKGGIVMFLTYAQVKIGSEVKKVSQHEALEEMRFLVGRMQRAGIEKPVVVGHIIYYANCPKKWRYVEGVSTAYAIEFDHIVLIAEPTSWFPLNFLRNTEDPNEAVHRMFDYYALLV